MICLQYILTVVWGVCLSCLKYPELFMSVGLYFFVSLKLKVDPLILDHRTIVPETVFLFFQAFYLCVLPFI